MAGVDVAKEGWFTEVSTMWPGQGLSIKIDKMLHQTKSDFQVRRASFGRGWQRLHRAPGGRCCVYPARRPIPTLPPRVSQDIMVFESQAYGTVMCLDGVIQCTDRDEFSYQEMIAHLPIAGMKRAPKKVSTGDRIRLGGSLARAGRLVESPNLGAYQRISVGRRS